MEMTTLYNMVAFKIRPESIHTPLDLILTVQAS